MKIFYLLPILVVSFLIMSCKKNSAADNYQYLPDSSSYDVKINSGTLTITTPDSTVTYTAPKDAIECSYYPSSKLNISVQGKYSYLLIYVYGNISANSTHSNSVINFNAQSTLFFTNQAAVVNVGDYNNKNGELINGTFSGVAARGVNGSALNFNYPISGKFDFKLNTK